MVERPTLLGEAVEEVRETHVSWLYFTADTVFKLKKPVHLAFLDFRTAAARRRACEAEVRLGRRLSHGVYRAVRDAAIDGETVRLLGPCEGEGRCQAEDHVVEMARLPGGRCATTLLERGEISPTRIHLLARTLARFHAEAPTGKGVDRYGTPDAVATLVTENLDELAPFSGTRIPEVLYQHARTAQLRFLERRRDRLLLRVANGRVRDGHGDLHLEHVFFLGDPEEVAVIDALEFSDRYRIGDVASDIAFLAMSFDLHGHPELAEAFASEYAVESLDYDLYRVVDFYRLYRLLVRLKVACLGGDPMGVRAHVDVLRRMLGPRERPPFLLVTTGRVGSGKSAIVEAVAAHTGAVWISSDRVRKAMLGFEPTESAVARMGQGAYTREQKDRVYQTLVDGARAVIESGRPALLDATYPTPERRAPVLELAESLEVPLVVLHPDADTDVLRERIAAREGRTDIVSDARLEHFDEIVRAYRPPDEIDPALRLDLDTGTMSLGDAVAEVMRALPAAGG